MRIHLGKKNHKCPLCDYSSVRKDNLKSHMKTHDKNNDQSTTRKRTAPTSDLPTFLNNQQFTTKLNVFNHNNFKNSELMRRQQFITQNDSTLNFQKSFELNTAPNRFYPSINSSFNDIPQLYTFPYSPLAQIIKRRRFEKQTENKRSAVITYIPEQQTSLEVNRIVKDKYMNTQRKSPTAIDKRSKKLGDLFRPYEDIFTKKI